MRIDLKRLAPKRIDYYVLAEILGPFFGGILFFSFIFLMFQALRLAEFFIIHGVPLTVLGKMIALMMLSFLPISLPIAFLIGVLVGFGRLSADSELVAMKASGMSIYRLTAPVLGVSVIVVLLSLGLNLQWVPMGDREFKSTLIKVSNTKIVSSIKEGTFTSGFFDLLLYADQVDKESNRLRRVFIYDEREPRNPLTVIAREGEIANVEGRSQLASSAVLRLFNGGIHRNDIAEQSYQKIDFEQYQLFLAVEEGAADMTEKPRMIPQSDLVKRIKTTTDGRQLAEYRGELWRRYAVAMSPLLFVFLGVGFGTVRTRAVRAGAALVALVVIVLYWTIQAVATVYVHKGVIHPILGMQLPNLLMAVLAYRGYRSATW